MNNNNNTIKLDTEVVSNIVNDMMLAKFNENNQLINNIKNHVSFENDIERSIPYIQDKIDVINSYKTPIQTTQCQQTTQYQQTTQCKQVPAQQIPVQQVPLQQIPVQQAVQQCQQEYIEKENCPTKIQIVKLSVISIIIIAIICFIVWKYVESKYIYVIIIICSSIILCSDYVIYNKGWILFL